MGSFTLPRATRARVILLILVVLALDGVAITGYRAWWAAPCNVGGSGVLPPGPGTPPEDVIRTFFAAANDGDAETIDAVLSPDASVQLQEDPETTDLFPIPGISYVSNICRASNIETDLPRTPDPDEQIDGYSQQVIVFTQYDVTWKHPDHANHRGADAWDFWLGRNSDDQPWRIIHKGLY